MRYFTVAGPGDEDKTLVWCYTLNKTNPEVTPIIFHHPNFNDTRFVGLKCKLVRELRPVAGPLELLGYALDTLAEQSRDKVTFLTANCITVKTFKGWENVPLTKQQPVSARNFYVDHAHPETGKHLPHFVPGYARRAQINPTYYDTGVFSCLPREVLALVKEQGCSTFYEYMISQEWIGRDDWLNYLVQDVVPLLDHLNAFPNTAMPVDFKEVVKHKNTIAAASVIQFKDGYLPWVIEAGLPTEIGFEVPMDTYGAIIDEMRGLLSMDFRHKVKKHVELYASSNRWILNVHRPTGELRRKFLLLGKAIEQNCLPDEVKVDDPDELVPSKGGNADATRSKKVADTMDQMDRDDIRGHKPTSQKKQKRNKRKKRKGRR